jgi:LemA protein
MQYLTLTNIIIAVAVLLVLWVIFAFNSFIRFRNRAKEAWSDIEVQLKRRYDLIPNLVNTVKGYMAHEQKVFEGVSDARSKALGATGKRDKAVAENELSGTLKTLFAVSENYPELKANTNFIELQRELSDTENKIQAARRFFNGTVLELNTKAQSFPSIVIAKVFGFKLEEFFEVENKSEKENIKVQF